MIGHRFSYRLDVCCMHRAFHWCASCCRAAHSLNMHEDCVLGVWPRGVIDAATCHERGVGAIR